MPEERRQPNYQQPTVHVAHFTSAFYTRSWFASLAANPGSCTEEPHWDSKTGGDIGNRHGGVASAGTP